MKKAMTILATAMTAISLAACGSSNSGNGQTSGSGNTNILPNTQDETTNQNSNLSDDESGDSEYVWGEVGETLSTAWFDFNVTSATLYSEYNGNNPSDGCQFLVLEMWLNNTYNESVPMFWNDFDVEWDEDDSYELPIGITVDGKELTEEEYSLRRARSANLVLVYEVPEEYDEFLVFFDEVFDDNTYGDVFVVYLAPEQG